MQLGVSCTLICKSCGISSFGIPAKNLSIPPFTRSNQILARFSAVGTQSTMKFFQPSRKSTLVIFFILIESGMYLGLKRRMYSGSSLNQIIPWSQGSCISSTMICFRNPKSITIPVCSPSSITGPPAIASITYRWPWTLKHLLLWSGILWLASISIRRCMVYLGRAMGVPLS